MSLDVGSHNVTPPCSGARGTGSPLKTISSYPVIPATFRGGPPPPPATGPRVCGKGRLRGRVADLQ